tara:strand:- start:610 stop:816 length:207 start_codon:yes stop_codon:yes gene_type:complete
MRDKDKEEIRKIIKEVLIEWDYERKFTKKTFIQKPSYETDTRSDRQDPVSNDPHKKERRNKLERRRRN